MGHKIILCVNERGILLASLCSGGRGLAAGGRGTQGSPPQLGETGQYPASLKPAGPGRGARTAEAPATGGLGRPPGGPWRARSWVVGLMRVLAE